MIICALSIYDRLECGLTPPLWFSVKYTGFFNLPISWYRAPVRASRLFPPMALAASAARLLTYIECWNVPGASCESFCRSGELKFDNSIRVTFDMKWNIFSKTTIMG